MAETIIRGPKQKLEEISFGKTLLKSLQDGGSNVAMVDASTGEETTYKEMLERTVSLAQHLKKIELNKNDVISIISENSIYFPVPVIAALYLGVAVAPFNHYYTERELLHAMNISKPKVVFCSLKVLDTVIKVSEQMKCVEHIIMMDKCDKLPRFVLKLEDLFDLPIPTNFEVTPVEMGHTAAIMCSSGTTGVPKGVMLTHEGFQATRNFLSHHEFGNYSYEKTGMGLLPFYHAYGCLSHLIMIITNMKIVVLPRFEEKLFLSAIQDYKITYAALVPPLVLFLSKRPIVDNYDLSSLKEIICGAAPLSKEVQDAVIQRLGVIVRQGYGLTELTLAVTHQPYNSPHSGSVGVLAPGIECKVIDTDTGKSLGPNQSGELCFRGVNVMKGYAGDPKATAETVDKEGWLHSGDVGYYDQNNLLFIVDRYKELIKYKGFQVSPAELEGLLLSHKEVLDCAVIGKPDEEAGELPLAFVVKKSNSKITEKDILEFVAKNISYQKRLHGGVRFVELIPKNPTGKIMRRILREELK